MAYKTVAVLGASGLLGKPVVKQLGGAGFDLVLVSRDSSKLDSAFPGLKAKLVQAEASDSKALQEAFKGIESCSRDLMTAGVDAIVSLVGAPALTQQKQFIDAAVIAGVKRFISSEFGCDTQAPYLYMHKRDRPNRQCR